MLNKNNQRELAYVVKIDKVEKHPNADRLDICTINGWKVVTGRDEFKAGVQSVCDFYNLKLYAFFETGDILDTNGYEAKGLNNANHSLNKLYIALETATYI